MTMRGLRRWWWNVKDEVIEFVNWFIKITTFKLVVVLAVFVYMDIVAVFR